MGIWDRTAKLVEQEEELTDVVAQLKAQVKELEAVSNAHTLIESLEDKLDALLDEKKNLEIELATTKEANARETREIEHKVGLHKAQVEWEVKQAREEATLTIEKANLDREKQSFKKEVEFLTKRFEEEAKRREETLHAILDRLPTVTVDKAIDIAVGDNRNTKGE